MDNIKIGQFIKEQRKKQNLTQKELAEQLNITDRAISRWERGVGCPDISLLEELATILDITILELLKGQKLKENASPNNNLLLESMTFSKVNTLKKLKKISTYFTIFSITLLIIFILITNIKSIKIETKSYDFSDYFRKEKIEITMPPTKPLKEKEKEINKKIELILSTQGNFTTNDYSTIKTHVNLLKDSLEEQKNAQYLQKTKYTFHDLTTFYLDHQNLLTPLVDNKDIYYILLKIDPYLSDHLISYQQNEDYVRNSYFEFFSFLEQPYHIKNILPIKNYQPNPYYIIRNIYDKELILLNDIIKAGEIK